MKDVNALDVMCPVCSVSAGEACRLGVNSPAAHHFSRGIAAARAIARSLKDSREAAEDAAAEDAVAERIAAWVMTWSPGNTHIMLALAAEIRAGKWRP